MSKECFVIYFVNEKNQKIYLDCARGNSFRFTSAYTTSIVHYDTERKVEMAVKRFSSYFMCPDKKIYIVIDSKSMIPVWEWRPPNVLQYEKVVLSGLVFKHHSRRCFLFFKVGEKVNQFCSVCGMSLHRIPYLTLNRVCCFCLKKALGKSDELLMNLPKDFIEEVKQERIIYEIDSK